MKDSISIVLGGAAGQGVQTVESLLVGLLKNSGYHVFACKEYMSRVRGGTNSTEIRISSRPVTAYVNGIDLLFALDIPSLNHLQHRISAETYILVEDIKACGGEACPERLIQIPFSDLAKEIGDKIFSNVIAVGLLGKLFGLEEKRAFEYLTEKFVKKGEKILQQNIQAYQKGESLFSSLPKIMLPTFTPDPKVSEEIMMNGAETIAFGAIGGGCNFISAYPMSPHTGVLLALAKYEDEFGIIIDQAEDEIAAMNKTVAAWYAGARALSSTSGGGYDLMTEAVSMTAITETPSVIHIAQRPGPGTGLPTRTAQEDLNLALYAGHGEFPRVILAPGTLQEGYYLTQYAFNLADKYQIPVFILSDQYYVDTYYNFPQLDVKKYAVEKAFVQTNSDYKRYAYTEDGLSPRGIPGYGKGIVRVDTDEHDEWGSITEDLLDTRKKMVEKRVHKRLALLKKVIFPYEQIGSTALTKVVVSWGSNYHVIKEAIEQSGKADITFIHLKQLYPLQSELKEIVQNAKKIVILECNATGQLAQLIQQEFGIQIPSSNRWLRYDGMPFAVEEVMELLNTL
jgi:2-oxoglutarate ferredoxin oxidoreductase subunit alpha